MRKVLLLMWGLLLGIATINAQTLVYKKPINSTGNSGNGRAPQTSQRNTKVVYLITAAEMVAAGVPNGVDFKSIGFYYKGDPATPTAVATGTLKVYLQNTDHTVYGKGTDFNAALASMTKVSDDTEEIDATAAMASIPVDIEFKNGDPFTYTGGGVYVAFEWSNASTLGTANSALCNSALIGGENGLRQSSSTTSATGASNSITTTSNFRPNTHFSYEVPADDVGVANVYAMSTAPVNEGLQKITAQIVNPGGVTHNDLEVTLNVTGANTFTSTKTIATIDSEGAAIVNFDDFVPTNKGTNTITVSIAVTDGNANNNSLAVTQEVADGRYSHNIGTAHTGNYGFNAGAGLFGVKYYANGTVTLRGIKVKVGTISGNAINRRVQAVLLNNLGETKAKSAVYQLEDADANTFLVLDFETPAAITNQDFHVGLALFSEDGGAGTSFFMMAAQQIETPVRPATFYSTGTYNPDGVTTLGTTGTKFMIEALTSNVVFTTSAASVTAVYALSKNPLTYGAPETITTIVRNDGELILDNMPVALSISGANTFANTKILKLRAGESATVAFDGFTAAAKGTNTITVTPNADDTKVTSISQEITDGTYSYVNSSPRTNNYGNSTSASVFLVKYNITGTRKIKAVKLLIGTSASNTDKKVYAVLTNTAGTILTRSDDYTILSGDLGKEVVFELQTPTEVTDQEFMVGLAMIVEGGVGFFPIGSQTENPTRRNTFYSGPATAQPYVLTEFTGGYRYMISAITEDEVLPVIISTFTAKLNSNNEVALNWTVGTETNVNRYEVERSTNGTDFVKVAEVAANGSSSYSTIDGKPVLGVNYYRLKGVDNDGTLSPFKELRTVKVVSLSAKEALVYPNPLIGSTINVSLSNYTKGTYSYKLADVAGKLVQQGSFANNGSESNAIAVPSSLPKGVYVLQISNGAEVIQSKLIKQ